MGSERRARHLIHSLAEEDEEDAQQEPKGVVEDRHHLVEAQREQRQPHPDGRRPVARSLVRFLVRPHPLILQFTIGFLC